MTRKKQFTFGIIAGELKGKKIVAPDLGITRPPLTRLRKAIFDYLTPYLEGAVYLDLYCGTGSYLFEAVSRGAEAALGIEVEPKLCESIGSQAAKYGVSDRLRCMCGDVFQSVPRLATEQRQFDVIMLAPPQYQRLIDRSLVLLTENRLLRPGGQIVCQHDNSETGRIDWSTYTIRQRRKYGNTAFTILEESSRKGIGP